MKPLEQSVRRYGRLISRIIFKQKLLGFAPTDGSLPSAGEPILLDPDGYEKITGRESKIFTTLELPLQTSSVIVIGSLQKLWPLRQIADAAKVYFRHIQEKWEMFDMQVIKSPWPCAKGVLAIDDSNKCAAIFRAYNLPEQIGVLL
ncbi:hypothetical protein FVEN_g12882 [Fusarium venenatum]|nr:hypothetical protein FVEN_g12882 [Fusarium venenatum]